MNEIHADEAGYERGWEQAEDYWRAKEQDRIINDLKDQFAFVMECETKEGLQIEANSIYWSERWQLTFNDLIALIKGENK